MESQIELTNSYLVPQTFNSLGSPPSSTNAVITTIDNDEDETLEPKKKKQRLGSWWDDVNAFNELSCVVKGLQKAKDDNNAQSRGNPCFSSSTDLHETKKKDDERSQLSSHHDNFIGLCEDESYSESSHKENQHRVGYGHVAIEDLSETMDPWLGGYVRDIISPVDSCFSSSSTDLHETKKKKNKDEDDEKSLSSSHHHDNFIDLSEEDESVGASYSSSNKGNEHVSVEDLGVSVEDLKSLPWEAFDPTWEIRSETMDPWLGGYVRDMSDPLINTHA